MIGTNNTTGSRYNTLQTLLGGLDPCLRIRSSMIINRANECVGLVVFRLAAIADRPRPSRDALMALAHPLEQDIRRERAIRREPGLLVRLACGVRSRAIARVGSPPDTQATRRAEWTVVAFRIRTHLRELTPSFGRCCSVVPVQMLARDPRRTEAVPVFFLAPAWCGQVERNRPRVSIRRRSYSRTSR